MASKKKSKKTKKKNQPKKSTFLTVLMVIILIFGGGGFLTFNLLTKNDEFSIIGEKNITLTVGDAYVEQGAKIISFGSDKSESVIVESTVDTSVAGEYYVKYSSSDYRFKNVIRYRYVVVEEVGE